MGVYLSGFTPFSRDPRNLFALRCDLHLSQFNQAHFVVHFLQPSKENAQLYHNVQFRHNDTLSHELLYSRFA